MRLVQICFVINLPDWIYFVCDIFFFIHPKNKLFRFCLKHCCWLSSLANHVNSMTDSVSSSFSYVSPSLPRPRHQDRLST